MLKRWSKPILFCGLLLGLCVALINGWPSLRLIDNDIRQTRLNTTLPTPQNEQIIAQTFRSKRDGLTMVQWTFARSSEPTDEEAGELHIRLINVENEVVAQQRLQTRHYRHNQEYTFRFDPLPESAGEIYTLEFIGNETNPLTVWAYTLDTLADGELNEYGQENGAQELFFSTRYRLQLGEAVRLLGGFIRQSGLLILLAILVALAPGIFVLQLNQRSQQWDPVTRWGVALAVGLSLWALLWLWLSFIGARWHGPTLWMLVVALWVAIGWRWWRAGMPMRIAVRWEHAVLAAVLLGGLAVRLLAVRDLAFPAWVDASRHGLITTLMVETGRFPTNYHPFLPINQAPYHYGFHTFPATLKLMSGRAVPTLLLIVGQLLNALVPLTAYSGGWLITRRRSVGIIAAMLIAFPLYFPAYYATWGRLTQLHGMVVLPVLLAVCWQLVRGARLKSADQSWAGWHHSDGFIVALLAAGLFLIHARVFILFVPFAALLWLSALGREGKRLLVAAAAGLILIVPRLLTLAQSESAADLALISTNGNYNRLPTPFMTVGWEQHIWYAVGVAVLIVFIAALRRQRWTPFPLLLVTWVLVLGIGLSGRRLGLPELWLINLNSMFITLFLPVAWLLAVVGRRLWSELGRLPWVAQIVAFIAIGWGMAILLLFGIGQQINIINGTTVLSRPADIAALTWLDANVSTDAHIAVGSWKWLGNTWAAADAGAWIGVETGRSTTTPPVDYIYGRDLVLETNGFNELASQLEDWGAPEATALLRTYSVTHLFVGQRGSYLDPAELSRNPGLTMIYQEDGAFIFAVQEE